MRIAALDLGSNSFHLVVVEARLDGSFVQLAQDKEMLRLGDVVTATGVIGKNSRDKAKAVIRRFKAIADAQRADEIVALGTAALREAFDGGEFVDEIREEVGIEIKIVDGLQEAQLIFQAVCASVLIDPGPALMADLGGGSLELSVGDKSELSLATSVRLGVGRLTTELVEGDPLTKKDIVRLEHRIAAELNPVLENVRALKPQMLIGSSGTFVALARIAVAMRDGSLPSSINQLTVGIDDINAMADRLLAMTTEERVKVPGCDSRRAELLPAGIVVLRYLMNETSLNTLTISEWALREGIVLNAIGHHDPADLTDDPRAIRRASVLSLCRRSNWRQPHARQVAALALELFDATESLHGLSSEDRELLDLGAHLHDIGEHISRNGHDRHTAYLVENGDLRGFAPNEIGILASLGRYHLRGTPRPSFKMFGSLDANDRRRAVALIAILRIADALDSSHGAIVERVEAELIPSSQKLNITFYGRGDAELETWMARRKQDLFEKTFDVTCEFQLQRIGVGVYEPAKSQGAGFS